MIEYLQCYSDLAVCEFCLSFNLKESFRGLRFHLEDEIDVAMKVYFYRSQEMNGLNHLTFGIFFYISVFMLERTTLNTPNISQVNCAPFILISKFSE